MDVHGAPRPVVSLLRAIRTASLYAVGPFERMLHARSPGGAPIPPLWLRRHTGEVSRIDEAARRTAYLLAELELVSPGARVLDAGCGFGVMAAPLAALFGPEGRYVGFDAHSHSIRWAARHLASADGRISFVEARAGGPSSRFPTGDFLLAKSLFTHLPEEAARGALREVARTLSAGGKAFVTAFLFEPGSDAAEELFPYAAPDAGSRWMWRSRPEAAIAFTRDRFARMIEEAGLTVETFRPGFWPGRARLDGQDILILKKAV